MRYVAFLRAINVGTANRIKMEAMRDILSAAGLGDVRTYLQSGNVGFDFEGAAPEATETVERALAEAELKRVSAMVRTRDDLEALLAVDPYGDVPRGTKRYVTLLREPADTAAISHPLLAVAAAYERELLATVLPDAPRGFDFGFIEKQLRVPATTRYWEVVEASLALLEPGV
ncbi:MAG: DUF1697 domain-containing protein [Dehalococcoidia bacterium]